eukprot:4755377-Amphidinium_carterae.1
MMTNDQNDYDFLCLAAFVLGGLGFWIPEDSLPKVREMSSVKTSSLMLRTQTTRDMGDAIPEDFERELRKILQTSRTPSWLFFTS